MKKLFILVVLLWGSWSFADSAKDYLDQGNKAYNNYNYTKAAKLVKKACDMGNATGCQNLGMLYVKGQGVSKSYTKSIELFKRACDLGNGQGCMNIGMLYVNQNYSKAIELFKRACDLGNGQGCKEYDNLNK